MYFSKYKYLKINHYYLFFFYCLFINLLNIKLYYLGFYKLYIIYTFRLDLRYFLNIPKKDAKFINVLKNKFYKKKFSFIEIGSNSGVRYDICESKSIVLTDTNTPKSKTFIHVCV